MRTTARHLVGREEELDAIVRLLDSPEQLPGAVVLPGEAGIGKTTVWLAGLDEAAGRGYRILSSRPSETETGFSFAGLTDLLGAVAGDVLPELPPVQRRALESALLLGESDIPTGDRAVAAAFLEAIRLLAREGPLCVAVDDVQWFDMASLAALRYALGRLDAEPLAALLAVRGPVPPWLRRGGPEGWLQTVEIRGLSVGATYELLQARLDVTFPRPTLIRLWETSGGNPFFALELSSALERSGGLLAPGDELPMPSDLDELLGARLDRLGRSALDVAQVVAMLSEPTVPLVQSVVGRSSEAGLAEALAARILELDGKRMRFTHPLLGSAFRNRETPSSRRALHRRLAKIVPSAEERARHLALATTEPGGEIGAMLEQAARAAQARGAPAAAAELAEHARRLTPPGDLADGQRRLFHAAEMHHIAGDTDRAARLLEDARAEAPAGPERAAVLLHLAELVFESRPREGEALLGLALADAERDRLLVARIHSRLANAMRWSEGIEQGLAHAARAAEAAALTDDVAVRSLVLTIGADWRFRAGNGIQRAEMEEAVALERSLPGWPVTGGPTEHYCHQLMWAHDLDLARELTLELLDVRRAVNDPTNETWALWNLGMIEWRAGNWDLAERYVDEFVDLRSQLGAFGHTDDFPAAILAAHRGKVEIARGLSRRAVARGEAGGVRIEQSGHAGLLGFVDLSLGDPRAALEHLRPSHEIRNAFMLEPAQRLELGDLLEALVATGELAEAADVVAAWEPRAAALDRAWSLAVLARGRGLLLAARGDVAASFAAFERALSEHERSPDPFQHARTLLALGRTQRRAKKRGAARATLEHALVQFEQLGAPLWAEQARAELARIGGRAPSRDELTEAERRIAELVGEGRTNREVAAALFLTEHSVETALTRVYRKLGVRSRAELARRLAVNS